MNAFLSSARSVLYVARHQFGWSELRDADQQALSKAEEDPRKRFDRWYALSRTVRAVLNHPLTDERHAAVHRKGQAGFFYVPKPIGGLALEEGDAFRIAPFFSRAWHHAAKAIGLPLEDDNLFFYQTPDGKKIDAVTICREYLALIEQFVSEVEGGGWRQ